MSNFRIEKDSLGQVKVPNWAYWGAQTQRAVENFPVSDIRVPLEIVKALALIKREAAKVNLEYGILEERIYSAIYKAATEVVDGKLDQHFPLDIFQTGSGTSTNMNVNEVIANRAIEILGGIKGTKTPVHPNDHVNAGQSSNDTFPTAIHIATYKALEEKLLPALRKLVDTLQLKSEEFWEVVKTGRTHLQDAVPVRLGQEFSGYKQQVENGIERINTVKPRISELALGGTAAGTGLNAPEGFAEKVIANIASITGYPFKPAPNKFEALSVKDSCVELSGVMKTIAISIGKIANDIRWLSSGPRCGLYEITIPSLQPGSSIMPGKVNPVIPESVLQVTAHIIASDTAISWGGSGLASNFELNVMMPLIGYHILNQIKLLANAIEILNEKCIKGIKANKEKCKRYSELTLALATALVPHLGYDKAAEVAKRAFIEERTILEIVVEEKLIPAEKAKEILNPARMTRGGILK